MKVKDFLDTKDFSVNSKGNITIHVEKLKELLREFAEINCTEQRVICADMLTDPDIIRYTPVMNAISPLA